jgi:hypothetical protein
MKKIHTMLIVFTLGLLEACATPVGPCIQYVECPDNDCVQQAKELCPRGYSQLSESDVGADFGDFEKKHFAGAAAGVPHMLVTCN